MRKNIQETDLSQPIKEHFLKEGFTVRSEVKNCDITAMKDDTLIIIELKKNLSVDLLIQGIERQRVSDLVYIAVPKPKKTLRQYRKLTSLIKRLELGLIFVNFQKGKKRVEVIVEPGQYPFHRNNRKRKMILREINNRTADYNEGGSSRTKIMTAYKEQSLHIAYILNILGETSPRIVKKYGTTEKTSNILYTNFYGWFIRKGRGIYTISNTGKCALDNYKEICETFQDSIQEEEK